MWLQSDVLPLHIRNALQRPLAPISAVPPVPSRLRSCSEPQLLLRTDTHPRLGRSAVPADSAGPPPSWPCLRRCPASQHRGHPRAQNRTSPRRPPPCRAQPCTTAPHHPLPPLLPS